MIKENSMQDNKMKKIIMLPELFVFFIVISITFFMGFIVFLTYNLLYYENNTVLLIVLSILLLGASLVFPIIGIKAGVFDCIVLTGNKLIVLRLRKTRKIVEKNCILSIRKEIGYMSSTFIRINIAQNENQNLNKNNNSLMLSFSQKKLDLLDFWLNIGD